MNEAPVFEFGLCRCCGTKMKNCLKLDVTYDSCDTKEVYSEMIMDCYGFLLLNLDNKPHNRLICATCVVRLREALVFRKQVLQSEEAFLEMTLKESEQGGCEAGLERVLCDGIFEVKVVKSEPDNDNEPQGFAVPADSGRDDATENVNDAVFERWPFLKKQRLDISDEELQKENHRTILKTTKEVTTSQNAQMNYNNNHLDSNTIICNDCDEIFSTKFELIEHLKTHENIKTDKLYHKCKHCFYYTISEESMTRHTKLHDTTRKYACETCGFRFETRGGLSKHVATHSSVSKNKKKGKLKSRKNVDVSTIQYHCGVCDKKLLSQSALVNHVKIHLDNGKTPFICKQCGKRFPLKHDLNVHMGTHTDLKSYHCDKCGKKFTIRCNLITHLRLHSDEKPFSCEQCPFKSSRKDRLNDHIRTHVGLRPYSCEICGKGFIYSHHLKVHLRIHSGDKPFSCVQCGYKFSQKPHLAEHMKTHNSDNRYHCAICTRKFSEKTKLIAHLSKMHSNMKKLYNCKECAYSCDDKARLTNHMRKHTGEKPYNCEICDSKFSLKTNLKRHKKLVHSII